MVATHTVLAETRPELRAELGVTTLLVTHDLPEADFLADAIVTVAISSTAAIFPRSSFSW